MRDFKGEPFGWVRSNNNPDSDGKGHVYFRRRPDGDPEREYVAE